MLSEVNSGPGLEKTGPVSGTDEGSVSWAFPVRDLEGEVLSVELDVCPAFVLGSFCAYSRLTSTY